MSKNLTNVATTSTANALVFNNRFANETLTATQIGAENLKTWLTLMENLHDAGYAVYVECENNGLRHDTKEVNKSSIFTALQKLMNDGIGEVNGQKLFINDEIATLIIGYAGKRGNKDGDALQAVKDDITNLTKAINAVDGMAGVNPEYVEELKAKKAEKEAEKKALLDQPDNRIKQPTKTSFRAFRLDVEHAFARAITGQLAKSPEELAAEVEARRKERREKEKARKQAKKAQENA